MFSFLQNITALDFVLVESFSFYLSLNDQCKILPLFPEIIRNDASLYQTYILPDQRLLEVLFNRNDDIV